MIKIEPNGTDSDYAIATLSVIGLYLCKKKFITIAFSKFKMIFEIIGITKNVGHIAGIFALTITFSVLEFRYEYSDFEQVNIYFQDWKVLRPVDQRLSNINLILL